MQLQYFPSEFSLIVTSTTCGTDLRKPYLDIISSIHKGKNLVGIAV